MYTHNVTVDHIMMLSITILCYCTYVMTLTGNNKLHRMYSAKQSSRYEHIYCTTFDMN